MSHSLRIGTVRKRGTMSNAIFCAQCGTSNSVNAEFCTNCGASLHAATKVAAEISRPSVATPPLTPENLVTSAKSSSKLIATLSLAVVLLVGALLWNQFSREAAPDSAPATTLAPVATTSSTSSPTTSSTSTTTSTTTTLVSAAFGFASQEYWIDDVIMAQPVCDGSYITIIASTSGSRAASGSRDYSDGNYLRTDITCASLNPFFSSGALQGEPIYLIFFGPYINRYDAQQKCLDLGLRKKANCFVAPLTDNPDDRSVRYGPLDS